MTTSSYIFILAIFIWLGVLSYYLYRTISHYQRLVKGTNKENLIEILDNILNVLKTDRVEFDKINRHLQDLTNDGIKHIQKVGLLHYNPFEDTGGNQSFVLAILDGTDTGIVLTSLHSRGITRWYIKNVKEGKGVDHKLSEEEQKAIKQVVSIKK